MLVHALLYTKRPHLYWKQLIMVWKGITAKISSMNLSLNSIDWCILFSDTFWYRLQLHNDRNGGAKEQNYMSIMITHLSPSIWAGIYNIKIKNCKKKTNLIWIFLFYLIEISGLNCDVCHRSIPRRPGKQGYECRDCQLKCHKQCHVKTVTTCPNPTVLSMEL